MYLGSLLIYCNISSKCISCVKLHRLKKCSKYQVNLQYSIVGIKGHTPLKISFQEIQFDTELIF